MQEAKQLNLYEKEEIPKSEEIKVERSSDIIDNEILVKILEENVLGKKLSVGMLDGMMIIYNSASKNKIELYNPASLKLFVQAIEGLKLGYSYDEKLEKVLAEREQLIRNNIIRKHKVQRLESARQVLSRSDRD